MIPSLTLTPTTASERHYLERVNKHVLLLLWAHLPLIPILALAFGSSYLEGFALFLLLMSVPSWQVRQQPDSRFTSCVLSFAAVGVSGILIHLAKGMIEFHFHVFVVMAWLIIFGNPWAIVTAAGTAAAHHLIVYFVLPKSVFNYEATFGIVLLHAAFVVAEAVVNVFVSLRIHQMLVAQDSFQASSEQIRTVVQTISRNYNSSAERFLEQTDKLQSAASSLDQVNSMVVKTADIAQDAVQVGHGLEGKVNASQAVIGQLQTTFESLSTSTKASEDEIRKSFKDIEELLRFFHEIEAKTQIINDIVFQTKLLSFNASVEAARASEHGRGFAVVAEEVGNLAQMSGTAAKEINSLLTTGRERSKSIITHAVQRADKSFRSILDGVDVSRQQTGRCLESFSHVTSGLKVTIDSLSEIARANEEQKQSVVNLSRAFAEVTSSAHNLTQEARQQSLRGQVEAEKSLAHLRSQLDFGGETAAPTQLRSASSIDQQQAEDDLDALDEETPDFKASA